MVDLPKYASFEPDRHGNDRWYYRRGTKRIRLGGQPGDETFARTYDAAHQAHGKPTKYVYFLRVGSRVKIGTTVNLKIRIAALKCAISRNASLTYAVRGDIRTEQHLHALFAADRLRGEWFRYSDQIKSWIAADKEQKRHLGVAPPAAPLKSSH